MRADIAYYYVKVTSLLVNASLCPVLRESFDLLTYLLNYFTFILLKWGRKRLMITEIEI